MEWQFSILLIFGSLIILMLIGFPIAFCFLIVNLIWLFIFSGTPGWEQLISRMFNSLNTFTMIPLALFILMGDFMFQSGIAPVLIKTLDKWLGRLPGRLSLLSVAGGTMLATLTGTSLASVAILGSTLIPEMEKEGYKHPMTIGPILGSSGLAMLIPPSSLAVLCATISEISVGKTLLAIIMPGLLLAFILAVYIIFRCYFQPSLAPAYEVYHVPFSEKLLDLAKYVLPLGIIIFLVIGVMIVGIATPSEAAATGCFGTFLLAACYRHMNWKIFRSSLSSTVMVTGMVFLIIAGAQAFSQILAFSGASKGLAEYTATLAISPLLIVIAMQFVVLVLGCFMEVISIMMIVLPIFMPVLTMLGVDPIWFAGIFLVNISAANITPPFGMCLFVMKGSMGSRATMGDIYNAALPIVAIYIVTIAILLAFPQITVWLPSAAGGG